MSVIGEDADLLAPAVSGSLGAIHEKIGGRDEPMPWTMLHGQIHS